jgi:hypothetical protein
MRYFEALTPYEGGGVSLFLGGGITDCPDWQKYVVERLKGTDLDILNPRRANFPINDPTASDAQVEWEYEHLHKADAILFWFPSETLCPITLLEYGAHLKDSKPLFVGAHPDYRRKVDLELQARKARPALKIKSDLDHVIDEILAWRK